MKTVLTIAMLLASCASAFSQDSSTTAVPVFSWTGSYIGAFGGGLEGSPSASWEAGGLYSSAEVRGFNVHNRFGGIVGIQVGYDYQIDHLVFGIVGDFAYSGHKTKIDVDGPIPGTLVLNSKVNYVGTVRGRAGYAVDRALLYAHGGSALSKIENGYEYKMDSGGGRFNKDKFTGFVGGAGLEYAFTDHLSGQLEYSYFNFGKHHLKTTFPYGIAERLEFHALKAAINYRF